jgi:hypothetical protein
LAATVLASRSPSASSSTGGGSIAVESAPGAGSTFSIAVPLAPAGAAEAGFGAPDLSGRSILIVAAAEIEASLRRLRLLGRQGMHGCG